MGRTSANRFLLESDVNFIVNHKRDSKKEGGKEVCFLRQIYFNLRLSLINYIHFAPSIEKHNHNFPDFPLIEVIPLNTKYVCMKLVNEF